VLASSGVLRPAFVVRCHWPLSCRRDRRDDGCVIPPAAQSGGHQKTPRVRRRWLVGSEAFFEGGWFHKDGRGRAWDVEGRLVAVSLLGDVTVDLWKTKSIPAEVHLEAYAIGRDVDVVVPVEKRHPLRGSERRATRPSAPPSARSGIAHPDQPGP
jgi:hypothetical protein